MPAAADFSPTSDPIPDLSRGQLEDYLSRFTGEPVTVLGIRALGELPATGSIKGYGYGTPLAIECRLQRGGTRRFVLETVAPGPFGHEFMADRAQILLEAHSTFDRLPRHVRALDAGAFRKDGSLVSVGDSREFFLLMEFVEGKEYCRDLFRIRDSGRMDPEDGRRCEALCDYLVEIHSLKKNDDSLYLRRARELFGHSECLLGMTDSYDPNDPVFPPPRVRLIERACLDWRWMLKGKGHRLSQVHGDFHPWNILFQKDGQFRVLDRSRGEWGEPADDVVALALNYVFFSLQATGHVEGPFLELHERFWKRYLEQTGDREVLECVAPFVAFRGLVMASKIWYPDSSTVVREALRNLIFNVLADRCFDPGRIRSYCEES